MKVRMRPCVCRRVRVPCSSLSLRLEFSNHRKSQILNPTPRGMFLLSLSLALEWNERAQFFIAQVNPSPEEHRDINRKQNLAEKRVPGRQLDGDRPAEVARQKNRAQDRGLRNQIQQNAYQL